MARHFISLWLNPFDLWVDSKGWWFENSVSKLWVCLSAGGVKTVSWSCISLLRGWGSLWHLLVNFYMWFTISSCYGSIPLTLGLIERIGGLSTLCHSCRFACQHRVIKTFPGPSYLQGWGSLTMTFAGKFVYISHHFILLWLNPFDIRVDTKGWWFENSMSKLRVCLSAGGVENVSWNYISLLRRCGSLWHSLVNLYIWLTISSCYGPISLILGFIGRDGVWALCVIVVSLLVSRGYTQIFH